MGRSRTIRVLVCGGSDYMDRELLFSSLDFLLKKNPNIMIVHGVARGADRIAGEWAKARGVPVEEFPADWKKDGVAAGPIRNQRMMDSGIDFAVVFPGGNGTRDMVRRLLKSKVKVWTPGI